MKTITSFGLFVILCVAYATALPSASASSSSASADEALQPAQTQWAYNHGYNRYPGLHARGYNTGYYGNGPYNSGVYGGYGTGYTDSYRRW